jgi:hypothetical protein
MMFCGTIRPVEVVPWQGQRKAILKHAMIEKLCAMRLLGMIEV